MAHLKKYQKKKKRDVRGCCSDEQFEYNAKNKRKDKLPIYKSPYSESYFDSHCHLDWILFKNGFGLRDLPQFAQTNFLGNFGGCVTVSCAEDMIRPVSELINSTDAVSKHIYGTFGMHPHNAKEWNGKARERIIFALKTGKWSVDQGKNSNQAEVIGNDNWLCLCGHSNPKQNVFCEQCTFEPNEEYLKNNDVTQIVEKLNEPTDEMKQSGKENDKNGCNRVVAVGECGLDFHYNRSPKHIQKKVFIEQIEIAKEMNLPLVLHSRKAERDTIEIMNKYCPKYKRIHLHCFTDSTDYAKVMLDSFPNLMIGFTGAITFKNAHKNRSTVKQIPLKRTLLETDGPYMSPVPYRGKVAHPGYIPLVAEQVAKVHGISDVNKVLKQCRLNVTKVYGI